MQTNLESGKRYDRYWFRLIATAVAFSLFGFGGLILRFILFPPLRILYPNANVRMRKARLIIHHAFRLFIGFMHKTGIYTYDFKGESKLQEPGQLILANHPTLIDVVFLISRIPNANCIVKASLFRNPFMRGAVMTAGYIPNDDPEKIIELASKSLKKGESVVLFPEGTRSVPGKPFKFQRGAAYMALRSGISPTLVTIRCNPPMLMKNIPWYSIPLSRPHFEFDVSESWEILKMKEKSESPLVARQVTQELKAFYTEECAA
ncbi:1-acyl-sn-glycerol-3-phosphate acyltransferase [Microbulbifer variabilis]|uniref:1-acyl-sn-glycerol-3-phosphate acyltransferase n=1 Tax=Microbulbifer variabilis TaxID=266805 RepID=A0ABY4VFL4_9GAMM|nr:lysophospholipid acyltransferase family protein [Microbulbifer variabilis]USD21630.1 1-acyl-sn-glycerol-3-phosphate acyltransferase [Microbulbifer variabilis]